MELLEVHKISKTYGSGEAAVQALKQASFSVPRGEFVAVVGESGSGKSTLLNLIGGLDTPTAGKVYIDGRDIFAMKERNLTIFRRRNIGFIFQSFHLIPELTVEQNIILIIDALGLAKGQEDVPLGDRKNMCYMGSTVVYGRGRALITRPALILADEPTGNLDTRNTSEVIALLKEASHLYEQTIVMITHSQRIAQAADRILRVSDGVVTDFGRCRES